MKSNGRGNERKSGQFPLELIKNLTAVVPDRGNSCATITDSPLQRKAKITFLVHKDKMPSQEVGYCLDKPTSKYFNSSPPTK